jgi:hypothetical protein
LVSHSWNGHTIEVRFTGGPRGSVEVTVAVDGGRPQYLFWDPFPKGLWNVPNVGPGGWITAKPVGFDIADAGVARTGRVEFDYSYVTSRVRYRVLVGDDEIGNGDLKPGHLALSLSLLAAEVFILIVIAVVALAASRG